MEIVEFQAAHIFDLRLQKAQQLFYDKFSGNYAEALERAGGGWTAMVDGRPIACAGIVEQWHGRGLAWALIAEDAGAYFVQITRAVRRALDIADYRRIEANVDAEFGAGIRWARMLGFEVESKLAKFTPEGRDAFMFARFRHDWH